MKTEFGRGKWDSASFILAHPYRVPETPNFIQADDCITNQANPEHSEGFDNLSLITRATYEAPVTARITCAFEELGCPEIIIVEHYDECESGSARYGACFEVVLYKQGINVWRHYRENGSCFWHKRLGWQFPLSPTLPHTLTVTIQENYLDIQVDTAHCTLRADDLPTKFHLGTTMCEGIARIYDMDIS